jgi:succinate-semialdehyde dehydrogenase/glutarate-semialdehyde dehydrogenase
MSLSGNKPLIPDTHFGLMDSSLLRYEALVGDAWVAADDGSVFLVTNPANGVPLAQVANCGRAETDRAIAAAAQALPFWRSMTAQQRCDLLYCWYEIVLANIDDLAIILTAEQGKPLAEARGEIAYGARYIRWFAEEGRRVYGDVIAPPSLDRRVMTVKQGVGVVACITPWNFPMAMLARKLAPALAAGCTVVFKPANETPLSAFALAELARRAGIPDGVINGIAGRTIEIGNALTQSDIVKKLTFTGSTSVGKLLVAQCAATMKRTSMELGGDAPFIIFDDADLDAALAGLIQSKFRNAGQTCVCTNRIFVQDTIYDSFAGRLVETVRSLKMGDGRNADVDIGPVVSAKAADQILEFVGDAVSDGAIIIAGGRRSPIGQNFIEPTVLSEMRVTKRTAGREIFGPIATLYRFSTEGEAVSLANDTPFGLAAYFYTSDHKRIWRLSEALEFGMVGVNEGMISNEMAPFGGIKQSGHGREGSRYGLDDYLDIKYVCIGGLA